MICVCSLSLINDLHCVPTRLISNDKIPNHLLKHIPSNNQRNALCILFYAQVPETRQSLLYRFTLNKIVDGAFTFNTKVFEFISVFDFDSAPMIQAYSFRKNFAGALHTVVMVHDQVSLVFFRVNDKFFYEPTVVNMAGKEVFINSQYLMLFEPLTHSVHFLSIKGNGTFTRKIWPPLNLTFASKIGKIKSISNFFVARLADEIDQLVTVSIKHANAVASFQNDVGFSGEINPIYISTDTFSFAILGSNRFDYFYCLLDSPLVHYELNHYRSQVVEDNSFQNNVIFDFFLKMETMHEHVFLNHLRIRLSEDYRLVVHENKISKQLLSSDGVLDLYKVFQGNVNSFGFKMASDELLELQE